MAILHPFRRQLAALALAFAGLAVPGTADAWTRRTHEAVALQAARLMPTSLQSILAEHRGRLRQGAVAPLALRGHEGLYLHAGGSYGTLDQTILVQSQRVLDLLSARAPMPNVAYELGVLSHYIALAQDPLHVSADDPREAEWAADFEAFTESRLPRFRLVFDGYLSPALARDDVRGFVRERCDRARRHYGLLARSYVREDGSIARGASFDDRHPVFGIASLAYARSVSDTAKLWLYLWINGGGDTAGLPFPQGLTGRALVSGMGQ